MDAVKVARTVTFVVSTLLAITDKKTPASVACSPVNVVLDQSKEVPLHISQILLITFLGGAVFTILVSIATGWFLQVTCILRYERVSEAGSRSSALSTRSQISAREGDPETPGWRAILYTDPGRELLWDDTSSATSDGDQEDGFEASASKRSPEGFMLDDG